MLLRRLAGIGALTAVVGCAAAPTAQPRDTAPTTAANGMALGPIVDPSFAPQPDAGGRAHLRAFSFEHSASWLVYPGLPLMSTLNQTVGYVSTETLQNRCARTPANGDMVSESCGPVLDTLPGPNGVLVRWVALSMPGQRMAEMQGEHVTLAGRAARWSQSAADPWCSGVGGTTAVSATVLRSANPSYDDMLQAVACLASADDVPAVRAMLDSLQFDPSPPADSAPPSPAVLPTAPAPVHLETTTAGDLTFRHDSRWLARPYTGPSHSSGWTYTYVSTEPVDEHCTTAGGGMSCTGAGVAQLKSHGVFATWTNLGHPGLRFGDVGGERLVVDGRPAMWSVRSTVTGDGTCADTGGATTVALGRILLASYGGGDDDLAMLFACLESPDELAAVKAMFASAQFPH